MSRKKYFDMGRDSHRMDAAGYTIHRIDMEDDKFAKMINEAMRKQADEIMRSSGLSGQILRGFEPPTLSVPDDKEMEIQKLRAEVAYKEMTIQRQSEELAYLYNQVRSMTLEVQQLQMEKANAYGVRSVPAVIVKHLKFIIFAVHPDRNPGRKEAEEVTRELLKLR